MNRPENSQTPSFGKSLFVGAANIDLRCQFDSMPVDGISNPATVSQMIGGAAFNSARMFAACGCNAVFCGLVGDDEGAHQVAQALDGSKVENALIKVPGRKTSHYVSLLAPDGSLRIAANDMVIHDDMTSDIVEKYLPSSRFTDISALFCDANIPAPAIEHLFKSHPRVLKFATTVSPAKAIRLNAILADIDVLFTNVAEAASLLQTNSREPQALALQLSSQVAKGIISNGDKPLCYWQHGTIHTLKVEPVADLVDVTGAGDGLAAGTMAAIIQGKKFPQAVQQGINTAHKVLKVAGPYSA